MAVRLESRVANRVVGPRVARRRAVLRRARSALSASPATRRGYDAVLALPKWMIRGYQIANAGDLAAAIAFNAVVAIVPIFLLLISLGGLALEQDDRLLTTFIHAVLWALPREQTQDALKAVLSTRQNSPYFAALSLIGFAWVGANFVSSLARGMNRVYGVPGRRFVHQRARDFLVVVVFAVLFLLASVPSIVASLFVNNELGAFFDALAFASGRVQALSYGVSILASLALFTVLYRLVPNAGQRMRNVWPGILTAAVLFVLLLQVFPVYLRLVGNVNRYGQFFGFIPLIVAWFYLLAHVLLFGTYVNATFLSHCRQRKGIAGHSLPGCEREDTPRHDIRHAGQQHSWPVTAPDVDGHPGRR
jgi:membrane protein